MNALKNTLIVLLSLTTIGSAYLAWSQHEELKQIKPVQSRLTASRTVPIEAAITAIEQTTIPSSTSKKIETPTKKVLSPQRLLASKRRAAAKRARQSPAFKRLQAITKTGLLEMGYAALANKLNLTPDQRKNFYAFLQEKRDTRSDVYSAARSQGLRDRATIRLLNKQQQTEIDQSMREALGSELYDAYQYFEQTRSSRHFSGLVEKRLVNSPNPLTDAQREQLTEIMHRTRWQHTTPIIRNPNALEDQMALETGVQNPRSFTEAGLVQSRGILTPNQYEALEAVAQENEARMKMADLIQAEIQKVTPATP